MRAHAALRSAHSTLRGACNCKLGPRNRASRMLHAGHATTADIAAGDIEPLVPPAAKATVVEATIKAAVHHAAHHHATNEACTDT